MLSALCLSLSATAQNIFTPVCHLQEDGEGTLVVEYKLDEGQQITAYSFEIVLPEGLCLAKDQRGNFKHKLGACHHKSHSAVVNYVEKEDMYAIACLSLKSAPLTGSSGELLTLYLQTTRPIGPDEQINVVLRTVTTSDLRGKSGTLDGTTTTIPIGIDGIRQATSTPNGVHCGAFNINGTKIDEPSTMENLPHGVYIVNGKKMTNSTKK